MMKLILYLRRFCCSQEKMKIVKFLMTVPQVYYYYGSRRTKTEIKYLQWIMLECIHAHICTEKDRVLTATICLRVKSRLA